MSNTTCSGCNNSLKSSDKIICTQARCKKQYHYLCVNLASTNFKKQVDWKCPDCSIEMLSAQRLSKNDDTPVKSLMAPLSDESQNVNKNARGGSKTGNNDDDSEHLRATIKAIMRDELHSVVREVIREEFSILREEIRNFEDSISFMNAKFEEMKNKVEACTEDTKQLRTENDLLQRKVRDLESRLSVIEQDSRQNNIEIHCLPEHKQENLSSTLMQVGKVIGFPIAETDILSCNRVQKQNKTSSQPKTVICRFVSKIKRDNILAAVYKYNRSHPKEKLNTRLLGYGGKESPVYISEHLTQANKSLHAVTRIWAKENNFKYVWVRNGKIFIRKDDEHPAKLVLHQEFLKTLC